MKRGFTIIEILVATSIMMVLFGIVIARYNSFNESEKVRQAALTLKADLRLAQTKARSGQLPLSPECLGFGGYYVDFVTDTSYTIAPECNGSRDFPLDTTTVTLPVGVTFSPLPTSFYYRPMTQGTSLSSDELITLTNGSISVPLKIAAMSGAVSE